MNQDKVEGVVREIVSQLASANFHSGGVAGNAAKKAGLAALSLLDPKPDWTKQYEKMFK